MANTTELERLVVRLTGDNTGYQQALKQAQGHTERFTKVIAQQNRKMLVEGRQLTEQMMTVQDKHKAKLSELNNMFKKGALDHETYQRTLKKVNDEFDRSHGLLTKLVNIGSKLSLFVTTPIVGLATAAVYAAGRFEQTTIAFETMLGSATDAQKLLADLTKFAEVTPFEMPEIEQAARGLVQFGERGDELMETLEILGNAAAGTSTNFGMVALIFNQVRGVGRLLTQDFRQLSTRGIISLEDIAKHFKVTTEAAQGMLSAGKVSFKDLRDILKGLSGEGGRFANMLERQSASMLGRISTLKDAIGIELRKIGQLLLPIGKKFVEFGLSIVEVISGIPAPVKTVAVVMLGLVSTIGPLLVVGGKLAILFKTLALKPLIDRLGRLSDVLTSRAIPSTVRYLTTLEGWKQILSTLPGKLFAVGAAIAVLGNLAEALGLIKNRTEEAIDAAERFNQTQRDTIKWRGQDTDTRMKEIGELPESHQRNAVAEMLKEAEAEAGALNQQLLNTQNRIAQLEQFDTSRGALSVTSEFAARRFEKLAHWLGINVDVSADWQVELAGLKKQLEGLTANTDDAFKNVETLKAKVEELGGEDPEAMFLLMLADHLGTMGDELSKFQQQLKELGASNEFIEKAGEAEKVTEAIIKSGSTLKEWRKDLDQIGMTSRQKVIADFKERGVDTRDLEGVDAALEAAEKADKLRKETDSLTKSLETQIATFKMTSEEAAVYKLQLEGATEEELKSARAMAAKLKGMREHEKLIEKGKELTKRLQTPAEQLEAQREELEDMLSANAISIETYDKALRELEQQAHKDYTADFRVTGVEAVEAGSAEALAQLEKFQSGFTAIPGLVDKSTAIASKSITPGGVLEPAKPPVVKDNMMPGGSRDEQLLATISTGIQRLVQLTEQDSSRPIIEFASAELS